MPKTQEELNELKKEYEILNNKLTELTEEELKQVTGGDPIIRTKRLSSEDLKAIGLDEDPTLPY